MYIMHVKRSLHFRLDEYFYHQPGMYSHGLVIDKRVCTAQPELGRDMA